MNELDDENKILEMLRAVPYNKVCIFNDDTESKNIYESLIEKKDQWMDNSGEKNIPPDFINNSESIMLEVMRVNDTNSESNRRETQMYDEILKSGFLSAFPDAKDVTCIPHVHSQSYKSYKESFKHALSKHNGKVEKYKNNHPGINRIVFFICDESEAYFECQENYDGIFVGKTHFWFYDKFFVDILKEINVDLIIWYTPYKVLERYDMNCPEVVLIKPRTFHSDIIIYDDDRMIDATQVAKIEMDPIYYD